MQDYICVSEECKHPKNHGTNIIYIYNRKAGIVMKDYVVIDRFSPNFLRSYQLSYVHGISME